MTKGLSPDELSVLLGQQQNEEQSVSMPSLSSYEKEVLIEILSVSFGSASVELSNLLSELVSVSGPELSIKQRTEIEYDISTPSFAVVGNYTGTVNGLQFLFIQKKSVEAIAQLMNVNSDTEGNETLFQVVQEVVEIMFAAVSHSMSAVLESNLTYTRTEMDLIENSQEAFHFENFTEEQWFVHASFQLLEGVNFTICIPIGTAQQIAGVITNPTTDTNMEVEIPAMTEHNLTSKPKSSGNSPNIQPVQFSSFDESPTLQSEPNNIDLLLDIPLQVTVELGRTKKMVKEILEVSPGSIIELDKLAGEPVDILVNNKLIAVGEVVVIDDNFGVRVTDILSPMDRISKLR